MQDFKITCWTPITIPPLKRELPITIPPLKRVFIGYLIDIRVPNLQTVKQIFI